MKRFISSLTVLALTFFAASSASMVIAPGKAEAACACAHTPAVNRHTTSEVNGAIREINQHTTNEINDVIYAIYLAAQTISGTIDTASKAQIENDANNRADALEAQTQSDKDIAKTEIALEQAPGVQACRSIAGGNSIVALEGAADQAEEIVAMQSNRRNRNMTNETSSTTLRVAVSRIRDRVENFCGERNQAAGECELNTEVPEMQDGDLRSDVFFGQDVYGEEDTLRAALAFTENVTNPLPPPPLNNTQMDDISAATVRADRNKRDSRMNLAMSVLHWNVAERMPYRHQPSVNYARGVMEEMGPARFGGQENFDREMARNTVSLHRMLDLEIRRRYGNTTWMTQVDSMPPNSSLRELVKIQALQLYLDFRRYELDQRVASIQAAQLAIQAENDYGSSIPAAGGGSINYGSSGSGGQ